MRRNLTLQAGLLTGSRAVGQIFNALSGIFVVRVLSQFDYGTYRQLILMWSTLILVGDAAFSQSLYQFIPGHREQARKFIGQTLLVTIVLALVWTGGLVLLAGPISGFFKNPQLAEHMLILGAYLGFSLLAKAPETALIALERVGAVALNTMIFEGMKFALMLFVLYRGDGITWLLRVMALTAALKLAHLLWTLRDQISIAPAGTLTSQFRYSMALWLPGLLNISGTYAHQYIVGYYFNTIEYAIYAVACFQVPLIGVVAASINEVFLVRATEYHKTNQREELLKIWLSACRKAQMIFLPSTIACVALAGPLVITLFTRRYISSVPLFMIMVTGLAFYGFFQDGMLRAYGAMRAYALFYLLRVALALGLGIAGARWFGLWGAAISTVAALVILNAAQLWKVAALLEVPFSRVLPWKDIGKIALASGTSGILARVCAGLIARPPIALMAGGIVFGVSYLALIRILELLSADDTRELVDNVRAGFNRLGILRPEVSRQSQN
ncbi:MAG: oligosaccharide flippase family protein [Acidipila sp.]|nr:oligosaccharide flippase family protein [Acidipila sp.]